MTKASPKSGVHIVLFCEYRNTSAIHSSTKVRDAIENPVSLQMVVFLTSSLRNPQEFQFNISIGKLFSLKSGRQMITGYHKR